MGTFTNTPYPKLLKAFCFAVASVAIAPTTPVRSRDIAHRATKPMSNT